MSSIKITEGDTFLADAVYRDANDDPVNLTTAGITIKGWVLTPSGESTVNLTVTIKDQAVTPGGYQVRSDSGTWGGPGKYRVRFTYTSVTGTFSSEPIVVELVQ